MEETLTRDCKQCGFQSLVDTCPRCGLPLGAEPTDQSRARAANLHEPEPDWFKVHAQAERERKEAAKRERLQALAEAGKARREEMKPCKPDQPKLF